MKLPHSITYTTKVKAGSAYMFMVRINPKYKNDFGLHAHEFEHVRQWYKSMFVAAPLLIGLLLIDFNFIVLAPLFLMAHNILYKQSQAYRLDCEVSAFKKQMAQYDDPNYVYFSEMLASNYRLGITFAQARELLTND